jgi:hypothetical protein
MAQSLTCKGHYNRHPLCNESSELFCVNRMELFELREEAQARFDQGKVFYLSQRPLPTQNYLVSRIHTLSTACTCIDVLPGVLVRWMITY